MESLGSISESGECDKSIDEEEEGEVSGLWYEALEFLSGIEPQTEPFYRLYQLPGNSELVKIFENEGAFVAEGTTGLVTWEVRSTECNEYLLDLNCKINNPGMDL